MPFRLGEFTANLPWDEIRHEYENSDISITRLAVKYGLKSRTTLARRIDAENWSRRTGEIAQNLATLRIAEQMMAADASRDGDAPVPALSTGDTDEDAGEEAEAEKVGPQTAEKQRAQAADEDEMLTVRMLALLHAKHLRRQLWIAEEVQQTGMRILRSIARLLDVPVDQPDKAGQIVRQLIAISPDKETMAGLAKAAADVVDRGVTMERRALGMDAIKGMVPNVESLPPTIRPGGLQVLQSLNPELTEKIRQFARDQVKARRQQEIAQQQERRG